MKRDMELVRAILLRAQEAEYATLHSRDLVTEEWTEPTVAEHMRLLREKGYIEARVDDYPEHVGAVRGTVLRVTWAGHEFVDAAANDTVWRKSLAFVKEKGGGASVTVLAAVLKQQAALHFGIPIP